MIPPDGGGDVPFLLGYLIRICEETSVEPSVERGTQDLRFMDPSGTIEHVPRAFECKARTRSLALLASQIPVHEIAGHHQALWQEIPSPLAQPTASTTRLPSPPLHQETTDSSPPANVTSSPFRDIVAVLTEFQATSPVFQHYPVTSKEEPQRL